jgi:hypothetical protein
VQLGVFSLLSVALVSSLGAQSPRTSGQDSDRPKFKKLVHVRGDTMFMAKPEVLRYQGPIHVPRENTPNAPDTVKILFVGDSAVTLNVRPTYHYSAFETKRLRFLVSLNAMLPDTPVSAPRKK